MTKREATVKEILSLKKSRVGHATHIPVLTCLSRIFTIKTVVELGSGPISTRLFLDRRYFRDLKKLISYETREGWYKKVLSLVGNDERLDYRLISQDTTEIDISHTGELLFLDGIKPHRRYGVEKMSENFDITVLHDFKINPIFKYIEIYKPPNGPITSIASNKIDIRNIKKRCEWDRELINNLCRL